MDLSTLYTLAKSHASYADFRNYIDKKMTGTPETVISKNEFTLIVKNRVLADVRQQRELLIAMLEWGTKENMVQQDLNNEQIVDLYLSNL